MALTFFWRCEGTTFDGTHDYSAGDTTATGVNSGALSTTIKRVGTSSVVAPASFAGGMTFTLANNGIFNGTLAAPSNLVTSFGFSVYWDTSLYTATGTAIGLKFQGTLSNDQIQVQTVTGGTNLALRLSNNTNGAITLTTTGAVVTADAWWGVVCRLNYATNSRKIEIYNAANTLVDSIEDTSTALANYVPIDIKAVAGLVIAQRSASHTQNTYFDNFFIANTYNEPIQSYLDIASYQQYGSAAGITMRWTL